MSQRGIRPWSLLGYGSKTGKHAGGNRRSQRKPQGPLKPYNQHRGEVMTSFGRSVLGHLPHRLTVLREIHGDIRDGRDFTTPTQKRVARAAAKRERRAA